MAESVARALALALTHIERRTGDMTRDEDLRALEEIAAALQGASPAQISLVHAALQEIGSGDLILGLGLGA